MRRMRGSVVFLIIVAIVATIIVSQVNKKINDYVRITALDYTAVVRDSPENGGSVLITERLTFDYHAASEDNPFWELWRDLPEKNVDGLPVRYNVLSVTQVSVNGVYTGVKFEQARKLYWDDSDYTSTYNGLGPNKWYHSEGPYDGEYNFECLLFYVGGLYRGTTVFEIQYEMTNAALKYADCSELYLSLYSGKTVKYLRSVKGQILIPEDKMPGVGNYDAYTYGTNSHVFDFKEFDNVAYHNESGTADYHAFTFNLNESQLKFKPYNQYIEFTLMAHGGDKHKFTENAPNNLYHDSDVYDELLDAQKEYDALPQKYKTAKKAVLICMAVLAAAILILSILIDRSAKKKYRFLHPAQDFEFYKEIPSPLDATFAAALAFCKHKNSDKVPGAYAAALLGLVQKNYIEIEKISSLGSWDSNNVQIISKEQIFDVATGMRNLPLLTESEEAYYGLIRKHVKGWMSLEDFQTCVENDYQNTKTFTDKMKGVVKSVGMKEGYLKQADYKAVKHSERNKAVGFFVGAALALLINALTFSTRLDLAFGAFFILAGGFIGAGVLLLILSRKNVFLTQLGEDEYSKWRGLYKYLNSETLMKEREVPELAVWEEYFIYATAFGIPEKVIKALKVKMPDFNVYNSRIFYHPYFTSRIFYHSYSRSFGTSVKRASHLNTFRTHGGGGFFGGSGGFFGGGGYGGAGRGGGGGGGGHG